MSDTPRTDNEVKRARVFGSVFATMPDGTREQARSDSRAGLVRAVINFRDRGGTDINVFDPWLPQRPQNVKVSHGAKNQ